MEPQATILVVDDNEALRYALVRALQSGGYKVMEAGTGEQALHLAAQSPDLITLDIKLPDIDGFEVCRRLRNAANTRRIPILHISASFVAKEDKVRALEGGADGYLTEPVSKDELVATVRALLRLKSAEEDARRRERELRFLADSIPHLVWMTDGAGNPIYFNVRWYDFTGFRESDSVPKGWLEVVHRDDLARISELWQASLQTGDPFQSEGRYRNASGEYRWMSMRAVCMQHDGTQSAEWFGTSTDITEERRKEDILRQTEKMALAGRLAASIAHEVNNPLEAVTNIFYILENSKTLSHDLMDLVHLGNAELKRVSHIVRQSLSYYRSSEKRAEADIPELLDDTMRVLDPQFTANRISIVRRYSATHKVSVFPNEIRQVFSNLILNAIDAMPQGGRLVLKVRECRDWRELRGRGVQVSIADNGTGIPMPDRSHIFDAFFTTKLEKGTGLGLWVSNDMVRKHGGRIRIRSCVRPNRSGTVFSIFLPIT